MGGEKFIFEVMFVAAFLYLCYRFFLFRVMVVAGLLLLWGGITVGAPLYLAAQHLGNGRIGVAQV